MLRSTQWLPSGNAEGTDMRGGQVRNGPLRLQLAAASRTAMAGSLAQLPQLQSLLPTAGQQLAHRLQVAGLLPVRRQQSLWQQQQHR